MSWSVIAISTDTAEWSDLCKLFHVTDPQNLGIGRDVKETGAYTVLTPVCAWQIDAPSRQSMYDAAKQGIIDAQTLAAESSGEEAQLPQVSTKLDDAAESLYDLDSQVNEKVLLHGTKPETLINLLQNGLSERFSGGLFGCGSYLAEDASKIDQYCTSDSQKEGQLEMLHKKLFEECDVKRFDNLFYAIVVRVALGHPVFTKDGETNKDPPYNNIFANQEKRELALIPSSSEMPIHYHALIAEAGPASEGYKCARHREFVVFDSSRIIEEYVVGYLRDMAPPPIPGTIQTVADDSGLDDALRAECGNVNNTTNAKMAVPPVKMFPVEGIPKAAGIAISPCGTFALVGNNSDSEADYKLGRLDLHTGALTFPYSGLSDSPWSVAIAPNSAFALVADRANDKVVRIDLTEGSINLSYANVETANQVAISSCGTFALAACENYKIAKIDISKASSGEVSFPFAELDVQPQGIAIAPCGSYALYSHESAKGGIGHLDLKTGETDSFKYKDNRLERCDHVTISPTGTFALVAATTHGRLDLRTDELTFVDDYDDDKLDIHYPLGVSISPTETYALVTCQESGKVFCISNAAKAWKPAPSEQFEEDKKCCCSLM
eukprot:gnl/MRDRNA2_/MRDRNA2_61301_c0_seq2.p1 gnl/MRDRNA2_/MRDRNA2_61301_c0~~gnl/MRDRNA2_/MRDRNA2_61301_c0_seq2.p1  ORF type:complete len:608 (-),score=87.92 gnl/MRDRNA2_/MRDRNA2_61301_c0_seq2:289-2112(-)